MAQKNQIKQMWNLNIQQGLNALLIAGSGPVEGWSRVLLKKKKH